MTVPFDLVTPDMAMSTYADAQGRASEQFARVNVLITGNSGVGKSTVINSIFGSDVAQTGVGKPQTMSIDTYDPPDTPLRIYDTRGFEIAKAEETVSLVRNKITQLREALRAEDQIHIAWVCILEQSHRVEPVHQSLLRMLNEQRPSVPSLVLITQAFEANAEMASQVRKLAVPNAGVVPILALPKSIGPHLVPAHGVNELIESTLQLLPDAQKNAFIAAQTANWSINERAVIDRINLSAVLSGSSALIPWTGGHTAALLSIQMEMLVWINRYLGITLSDTGGKDLLKGLIGLVVAKAGGQTAFWMVMSEAAKLIPGFGLAGAAMVGGPIAMALTKTLGHVYFDSVSEYAKSGAQLPPPDQLADAMKTMLEQHRERYRRLSAA